MTPRTLATAALTLAVLAGVSGCSSDDDAGDAQPAGTGSPSGAAGSPSSTAEAGAVHAVRFWADAASASYCVLPDHDRRFGDYLWSGVRLKAAADATIVGTEHSGNGVDLARTWIVPSDKPAPGELVPWANGRKRFLPDVEWDARQEAEGARLEAGHRYTVVLRLRPRVGGVLDDFAIHYRGADGGDSGWLRTTDRVSFERHC